MGHDTIAGMTVASAPDPSQRPLLVAAHGWLLSGRLWRPLQQQLAPHWSLWAPDLPGFGDRPRPRGLQPNLASYGRWLAQQCLQRLQPEQGVVLLGHSLGGSIVTHAVSALGERLRGVVQIAAGGGVYQPRPFRQVRRGGALFVRWRPRWLLTLPGTDRLRSPLVAEERAARGLLACSMRRSAVEQLPQLTARLAVPSLWIAGSRDTVMEPRYVRHLAGYAPQHELSVLEGVGHLPMLEQPERLAQVLLPWLDMLTAAEAAQADRPNLALLAPVSDAA